MSRCGECKLGCNEKGALFCEENLGHEQCIDRLQDALYATDRPNIDIVRCKECDYYEAKEYWCYWRDEAITPDGFCSYGEREGE